MKREKLKLSTILSYALATGSGYQIMGSLVGAYLMIFLTDTFGVPAGAVGVITVVASVWDAINDPMIDVYKRQCQYFVVACSSRTNEDEAG